MSNTLYTQVVHLLAIVALAALVAMNRMDVQTGVSGIALLVGIALPSPFNAGSAGLTAAPDAPGVPSPILSAPTPQTSPPPPPAAN